MKNVLLSTLGESAKTVTEMYQALKFENIAITEVHLVGTEGSTSVPKQYRPDNVIWQEHLCQVPDVRNTIQAQKISDKIFNVLKQLKERDDIERVFLDLTGGRKTMSSYLMLAAHLLCSPKDKLYHVETNDPKGPLFNRNGCV